jgi:hypothetical protein
MPSIRSLSAVGRGPKAGAPVTVQGTGHHREQQSAELHLQPHSHTTVLADDGHRVLGVEKARYAHPGEPQQVPQPPAGRHLQHRGRHRRPQQRIRGREAEGHPATVGERPRCADDERAPLRIAGHIGENFPHQLRGGVDVDGGPQYTAHRNHLPDVSAPDTAHRRTARVRQGPRHPSGQSSRSPSNLVSTVTTSPQRSVRAAPAIRAPGRPAGGADGCDRGPAAVPGRRAARPRPASGPVRRGRRRRTRRTRR